MAGMCFFQPSLLGEITDAIGYLIDDNVNHLDSFFIDSNRLAHYLSDIVAPHDGFSYEGPLNSNG